MKVNDIWVRETQEEEQRFRIYQQNIETEEAKTREYAENWEYYTEAYRFFAQAGPQYKESDLTNSGFYQALTQKIEECQNNVEENRKHLTGSSEQESQLFRAVASGDIPTVKNLADAGMIRAKFYYACHEAKQGNLQISRFKECVDKKESPYDAKAEMIILVHDADEEGKELDELKKQAEEMLNGSEHLLYAEYAEAIKRLRETNKQAGTLGQRMTVTSQGLKKFVKNRLVETNSSWPDSDFLEMAKSLEKSAEIAEIKKRLKTKIETMETRRKSIKKQRTRVRRFFLKAGAVALVVGSVYLLNTWVTNTYDGAKLYVELESTPTLVFQFENASDMNSAEIPEKILFFETEATTSQIFHNGEE